MFDPTTSLLTLKNVGLNRGGRWLVRGVDLSVHRGESVTLIGPNGAGKSTTAKIALGLLAPDEGQAAQAPGLKVGYVPQELSIDWTLPLTVRRFMSLTNRLSDADLRDALNMVGIGELCDVEVRYLSGGEFQRALLARAIARNPDVLVLDEPVQGVDFSGEIALYELIGEIRRTLGCGILMISHDLHVVMADTDCVVCMNGHVCCQGPPRIVAENPEYLALFGARAAGALAVYEHAHDHTHLPDGTVRPAEGTLTESCRTDNGHHGHDQNNDLAGHAR
ncbi:MAG: zinc ABC transporter ATP-binding protein [Alphaproteobacteria bacterium]|nr:zinc ABC transporter ATP-binding protein [Alphaproteobacteria bacterium]